MDVYHHQLLQPEAYPDPTKKVAYKETHISRLYLTDRRVYKLKKPLDLGFLDFTTLGKRRFFCGEEVRLNRRFNPDTYLGVFELRRAHGRVRFDGPGQVIDYAVGMQRLPEDRMLNRLIAARDPDLPAEMSRLAGQLREIFTAAEICREEEPANAALTARNCRENVAETNHFPIELLRPEARQVMLRRIEHDLQTLGERLVQRERDGFVRDGHGDLHAGNICMTEPIRIYDCIEFNRRFRIADIAADLAFLLMDLDFHDRRDLAAKLLQDYQAQAEDPDLERLLPFYQRYRAWVRGKVEGLLYQEPDAPREAREEAGSRSCRHFNLALGYALPPSLFLTCGLMGTGKTSLAAGLARASGASHLRSDVVRKELAGIPADRAAHAAYQSGLYVPQMTERTYRTLVERAEQQLVEGRSVIVDASFSSRRHRRLFAEMAARTGRQIWTLYLQCPQSTILQRLDQRRHDASDARPELLACQAEDFVPPTRADHLIAIDSTQGVDYNVQATLCRALADRPEDFS